MFKNGHCSFSTTTFFCKRQYFFSIQLNGAKRLQRKSHISNCRSSTDPRILYSPDLLPDGKECQTHYHDSIYEHTSLLVSFSVALDTNQTNKQSRFVYHLRRRRWPRKLVKIHFCLFVCFFCVQSNRKRDQ